MIKKAKRRVYANSFSGLSYTQGDCKECLYTFDLFLNSLPDLPDNQEICCDCTDAEINLLEKEYGVIK